jgi:hypothetical protein
VEHFATVTKQETRFDAIGGLSRGIDIAFA